VDNLEGDDLEVPGDVEDQPARGVHGVPPAPAEGDCTTLVVRDPEAASLGGSQNKGVTTRQRRSCKGALVRQITVELKIKFGTPKVTAANKLAVRRWAIKCLEKTDVRRCDQLSVIDRAVAQVFISSAEELELANQFDGWRVQWRQWFYAQTTLGSLRV
jgi:hypothetical protein